MSVPNRCVASAWVVALVVLACGCKREEPGPPATPPAKPAAGASQPASVGGPKVLMVIAPKDFRDEELLVPRHILEENGFAVVIASSSLSPAKGMLGAVAKPDVALTAAQAGDYAAVVFVGGNGAQVYYDNAEAHRLAQQAVAEGKLVGAICLATGTLARAGVLKQKHATGWPSAEHRKMIEAGGASYVEKDVVRDGKLVSAAGPQAAEAFGRALVEALRQ